LSDQDVQRLMNYYRNRYRMNDREVILGADSIASGSWRPGKLKPDPLRKPFTANLRSRE